MFHRFADFANALVAFAASQQALRPGRDAFLIP
jgi:hypothetical protein